MRQNPRLARTRTRNDEQRPTRVQHRILLVRVERRNI